MKMLLAARVLVTVALVSVGCTPSPEPTQRLGEPGRHEITGTIIRQLDASRVTLAHDAIKDYMPAMVMDVQADRLPSVRSGDRIRATLVVGMDATTLTDVAVVASGPSVAPAMRPSATAGTPAPDVILRNQFDRSIRVSDFRGRVLFVTFIYTRCPLPDFCPRLMRNFQELRGALARRPELLPSVHLLGVSIDPEFDTPDVLREYGEARLGGKKAFERLDLATGQFAEISRLSSFFGLRFEPAAGQISHTMVTAILNRDGQLVKRFPEMTWNLDEALAVVEREAGRGD